MRNRQCAAAAHARAWKAAICSCCGHCTGRLLVEVFEDAAPLATRRFLNRCREGSSEALQGTCVHRLVPDQGLFFGTSRGCATLQQPQAALPYCTAAYKALHQRTGVVSKLTVALRCEVCHLRAAARGSGTLVEL